MMKNARGGKNWDGAEKEVMVKQSAEEPANFAVSPIDRYVSKFKIIYFIIEMHILFFFFKSFTYLYLDITRAYHQPLSLLSMKRTW